MSYSRALEEQLALLRSVTGGPSSRVMRHLEYVLDPRYTDLIKAGRLDPSTLPAVPWEQEAATALEFADAYYWSPEIVATISAVVPTMPAWHLTPEALPSAHGFFWLAQSLPLQAVFGLDDDRSSYRHGAFALRALVWMSVAPEGQGWMRVVPGGYRPDTAGLAITTWVDWTDHPDRDGRPLLIPFHNLDWPFGETAEAATARYRTEREGQQFKREGFTILAAMLAFLNQRLFVAAARPVERQVRRRLERAGRVDVPLVRVVELRRQEAPRDRCAAPAPVAWSHQWVVSGHWHRYWTKVAGRDELQPRWVMPYIKGPDDKPLKPPRATVFAVVR